QHLGVRLRRAVAVVARAVGAGEEGRVALAGGVRVAERDEVLEKQRRAADAELTDREVFSGVDPDARDAVAVRTVEAEVLCTGEALYGDQSGSRPVLRDRGDVDEQEAIRLGVEVERRRARRKRDRRAVASVGPVHVSR